MIPFHLLTPAVLLLTTATLVNGAHDGVFSLPPTDKLRKLVERLTTVISKIPRSKEPDKHLVVDPNALRENVDAMKEISEILGTSGLDESDWTQYDRKDPAKHEEADKSGGYVRNEIYKDEKNFILKLLVWGGDALSPIHSHGNSECFILVLKGKIVEKQFDWNRAETIQRWNNGKKDQCFTLDNKPRQEPVMLKAGQTSGIDDYDAVHSIENAYRTHALETIKGDPKMIRGTNLAYTLHLYVPNYSNAVILKLPMKSSQDDPVTAPTPIQRLKPYLHQQYDIRKRCQCDVCESCRNGDWGWGNTFRDETNDYWWKRENLENDTTAQRAKPTESDGGGSDCRKRYAKETKDMDQSTRPARGGAKKSRSINGTSPLAAVSPNLLTILAELKLSWNILKQ